MAGTASLDAEIYIADAYKKGKWTLHLNAFPEMWKINTRMGNISQLGWFFF